jgi:hypothetical protein
MISILYEDSYTRKENTAGFGPSAFVTEGRRHDFGGSAALSTESLKGRRERSRRKAVLVPDLWNRTLVFFEELG